MYTQSTIEPGDVTVTSLEAYQIDENTGTELEKL